MAGGVGTGLFVTSNCFCCFFNGFEEIDVPRQPGGKSRRKPTKKAVREIVDEAKKELAKEHEQKGCKTKLTFGFAKCLPYRQDLTGIGETARLVKEIINR